MLPAIVIIGIIICLYIYSVPVGVRSYGITIGQVYLRFAIRLSVTGCGPNRRVVTKIENSILKVVALNFKYFRFQLVAIKIVDIIFLHS